jgi:uncharacterized protein
LPNPAIPNVGTRGDGYRYAPPILLSSSIGAAFEAFALQMPHWCWSFFASFPTIHAKGAATELMKKTILYAHGFKSSSRSRKVTQLREYIQERGIVARLITPDLSFEPVVALAQLMSACEGIATTDLTIVGSSLGGFYAVATAEKLGCRAVLLNPSIRPFDTLQQYLGVQTNIYTGEKFEFNSIHIAQLKTMFVSRLTKPSRYLLMVETGDEVLDYSAAVDYYQGAKQLVIPGGDHELKSFPQHIETVLQFAGIGIA